MEVPHLTILSQRYRSKGLVLIGLSKGSVRQTRSFVKEVGITYPVFLWRPGRLPPPLSKVQVVPALFLYDRSARLVWNRTGLIYGAEMRTLENLVRRLLSPPPQSATRPKGRHE